MSKGIYRFYWKCGGGDLTGIFTAESQDVKQLIGEHVCFGDVLGKHSQVEGTIEESEILLISQDQQVVEIFEKNGLENGYNPFKYLQNSEPWNER